MANTIRIKRSSTASAVPSAGDLVEGELAINTADKKLYSKDATTVFELANNATAVGNFGEIDQNETITGLWNFIDVGTGKLTAYDIAIGDTTTPDYGIARIGDSIIGRTSHTATDGAPTYNLDGAFIFQNPSGPVTGDIEFGFLDSAGLLRFGLPKSAVGNATYNPRSMIIAGPAIADSDVVTLSYWQGQGIFDNLTMDTATNGADLGVQNDLEVEGDIFVDSILESTTAAGVTIDGVLIKDGLVDGVDVTTLSIQETPYTFSSSTGISDPGAGTFKFNNTAYTTASVMSINDADADGNDAAFFLSAVAIDDLITLRSATDPANDWIRMKVTAVTDNTGWWRIDFDEITYGSFFSNTDLVTFTLEKASDLGDSVTMDSYIQNSIQRATTDAQSISSYSNFTLPNSTTMQIGSDAQAADIKLNATATIASGIRTETITGTDTDIITREATTNQLTLGNTFMTLLLRGGGTPAVKTEGTFDFLNGGSSDGARYNSGSTAHLIGAQGTVTSVEYYSFSGHFWLRDGLTLKISDSLDTDFAEFSHDGADFNIAVTNTTNVEFSGATNAYLFDDASFHVRDGSNNTKFFVDQTNSRVDVRDGYSLRVMDAADTDYAAFSHDGTDFNLAFTNTDGFNINSARHIQLSDTTAFRWSSTNEYFVTSMSNSSSITTTWYKLADISLPSGTFRSEGFFIKVIDHGNNYGASPENQSTYEFRGNYERSAAVEGDVDASTLVGTSTGYIRLVRTALGEAELQFKPETVNRSYTVEVLRDSSAGNTTDYVTWYDINDKTAASTTGTIVTPSTTSTGDGRHHVLDTAVHGEFRVYDDAKTDHATFSHDGTDFNFDFTNTGKVNFNTDTVYFNAGLAARSGQWSMAYDSTNADYIYLSHSGSHGRIITAGTGGGNIQLTPAGGYVQLMDGSGLRINDAANTDYAEFSHDGTDYWTKYATTNLHRFELAGTTQGVVFQDTSVKLWIDSESNKVDIRDGWALWIRDAGDTDYVAFSHDGVNLNITGTNTTFVDIEGCGLRVNAGNSFRISDATSADYANFSHDGTNFKTEFVNTARWDIGGTGLTTGVRIYTQGAGPMLAVGDAAGADGDILLRLNSDRGWDFIQSGTGAATSLLFQPTVNDKAFIIADTTGGQLFKFVSSTAQPTFTIYDGGHTDSALFKHDGTDFITEFTNTTDWNITGVTTIQSDATLKIKETASAPADTAAYGQLWVKNDTPNNLYFTDDLGNDIQITRGGKLATSRFYHKTADETVNNSAVLQNDDHLVSAALDADSYYAIEWFFAVTCTNTTPGFKFQFAFSQTPQARRFVVQQAEGGNTDAGDATTTGTMFFPVSSNSSYAMGSGVFRTNATTGGTCTLQWAQQIATAANTQLLAGSWMRLTKLG